MHPTLAILARYIARGPRAVQALPPHHQYRRACCVYGRSHLEVLRNRTCPGSAICTGLDDVEAGRASSTQPLSRVARVAAEGNKGPAQKPKTRFHAAYLLLLANPRFLGLQRCGASERGGPAVLDVALYRGAT